MAYRIAKNKKPHTIAEDLIKPCAEKIAELMIGPEAKKKIQQISLSNTTIRRRIDEMADDVCQQVCTKIKQSKIQASFQLDESTDTALESQLIAFTRYENRGTMKEEYLFCNSIPTTTTAADVKVIVESFFKANGLTWLNFKHICTDGAPAMVGCRGGFITLVKDEWPHITSSHCSLHRYALASKTLPEHLMEVMDAAVHIINFIRARAKNLRLFQVLAEEMGAQHMGLLYYTKVRWLSRGKCLTRLYELRAEVDIFLRDNHSNLQVHFDNEDFLIMLAYLPDVFGRLNEINITLQGRDITVSDVQDKLVGLSARMAVWLARIKDGSTASFPSLDELLHVKGIELPVGLKNDIIQHLESVVAEFGRYFDDAPLVVPWHKSPFNTDIDPYEEEAEELAELKVSTAMKLAFKHKEDISSFWLSAREAFPIMSQKASVMLVQFATTYLCESGFSDLSVIKTKARNRLDVRSDMRLAISKTEPNIMSLVQAQQEQPSH